MPKMKNAEIINSCGNIEAGIPYYSGDSAPLKYYLNIGKGKPLTTPPQPYTNRDNGFKLPILNLGKGIIWTDINSAVYLEPMKGRKDYDYEIIHEWGLPGVRTLNMKRLHNGRILCVRNDLILHMPSMPLYACLFDGDNWAIKSLSTIMLPAAGGERWITGDFAQMPDGNIWLFCQKDSFGNMALMVLSPDLEIIETIYPYIEYWSEFGSEGELPYIVCEPYREGIILSYHSRYYKFFSSDPFYKGAQINAVYVTPDKEKELLYRTDDYAERITPFALMGDSVIYGKMQYEEDQITFNNTCITGLTTSRFLFKQLMARSFRYDQTTYYYNDLDGYLSSVKP